jgi:hypothetical protein
MNAPKLNFWQPLKIDRNLMVRMSRRIVHKSSRMVRRSSKINALTRGRKGVECFGRRWDQSRSSSLRTALL